jgi:hypothetical protein
MTPPTSLLSPRVQAGIAIILLVMFAGVLFVPVFAPAYKIDPASQQALFTLVVMAVSFYLGSSSGAAKKDDQNAALTAQLAATPPAPPPPTEPQPSVPPGPPAPLVAQLPTTYPIELPSGAYATLLKDGWTDAQIVAAGMKIPSPA